MKQWIALGLAAVMLAALTACGGNASSPAAASAAAGASQPVSAERQKIEFWYHSANESANAAYESLMQQLNEAQEEYEFVYTGFSSKDFPDKLNMAIATDTMPDVISTGFSNVTNWTAQDALIDLTEYFEQFAEKDYIDASLIDSLRDMGNGKLYGVPYNYNQDMLWYNTQLFAENGIDAPPSTQAEFLQMCEQYADPDNGRYFFSLRGVKPGDNLIGWLFTYTDGLGYDGSYFDENGECILDRPEMIEALEAYASIYKNGWVSGNSVSNNYNEMVAEFGAGTSMLIMHNNSSAVNHLENLGEGNYDGARPLANEKGNYWTSSIQPTIYAVCNKGEDHDYSGAVTLVELMTSAEYVKFMALDQDRIPVNSKTYEIASDELFADQPLLQLYLDIMEDPHYKQANNPYWLPGWFNFINDDMSSGFQAILTGERTAADVAAEWSDFLESEQRAYLEENPA